MKLTGFLVPLLLFPLWTPIPLATSPQTPESPAPSPAPAPAALPAASPAPSFPSQVEQVTVTEPIEGGIPAVVNPSELGGTRHLSAAQFVQDQRDAVALVASQDGHFTVFAWSPCESTVHAHRVEALLL